MRMRFLLAVPVITTIVAASLASAADDTIKSLEEKGFYLQMPPRDPALM